MFLSYFRLFPVPSNRLRLLVLFPFWLFLFLLLFALFVPFAPPLESTLYHLTV